MGGRADFEERQEARKLKYEELSKKAEEKSSQYMNSTAHRILANTPRTTYNSRTSFWKKSKKITRKGLGRYKKINRRR